MNRRKQALEARSRRRNMAKFEAYRDVFPNAHLKRKQNGVLQVALHSNDGKLVFNGHTHEQFVDLFHAIGEDRDNRVVILTGTGDAFMDTIEPEGFDFFSPQGYAKILPEAPNFPMTILHIQSPLTTPLNSPR